MNMSHGSSPTVSQRRINPSRTNPTCSAAPPRALVPRFDIELEAMDAGMLDPPSADQAQRLGHDAGAPELRGDPVADHGSAASMEIRPETDVAQGPIVFGSRDAKE